jgi:plasmid stabilization system protein ParE
VERFTIIYSPKFWPRLNELLSYLKIAWSLKVADDFLNVFSEKINLLSQNPKIGKPSLKVKSVRSIMITKHNRMYYKVSKNFIMVIILFDNRQHPSKNKFV